MGESAGLKRYFGAELALRLAGLILPWEPRFPADNFAAAVAKRIAPLELKGRVAVISSELRRALPAAYPEALGILMNVLGPENETEEGMFNNGYFLMPVAHFVETYGLDHYDISMAALYEITKRHTSEYAIRPYLARYPSATLALLTDWAMDDNLHVRRLVSEGTRPRLPWSKRIPPLGGDPRRNLALLELLIGDRSFYVRKSVANHLNDLTKEHRDVALDWIRERVLRNGGDPGISWTVRHALRSLSKSGDADALALVGAAGRLNA
ncbi:DNA alkylation repair protein [Paenibacillaceae bacterium WGS1546]|uniref:DNA alkylation repair protein n=1 Tax=Cohnella sp. WGS1546 TaxID=3366810 RepID=UPI00372D05CE